VKAGTNNINSLVDQVHIGRTRAALALTGGATGAITALLRRSGGSRTVLDVAIPYAPDAIVAYLGFQPQQAVSTSTATALARAAFDRALSFRTDSTIPVVGLGCSAALATDRVRKGPDRLHVSTFDGTQTLSYVREFNASEQAREEQESRSEEIVLTALADAVGCPVLNQLKLLHPVERTQTTVTDPLEALRDGRQPWLSVYQDGRWRPGGTLPAAIVAGSFNPLHSGHRALFEAARCRVSDNVSYELSVENVDKSPLPTDVVLARLSQFKNDAPVIVTQAATFLEKAKLLPGVMFVIGVDTARRLIDQRYYPENVSLTDVLAQLRSLNCRFLVAGRLETDRFVELSDLDLAPDASDLFESVPAAELRVDISSTELRNNR
jgi:nicotinic acid mononucleotide adenylyltransferase/nicotinamide mononucleotide (NMN) deamidase PncC